MSDDVVRCIRRLRSCRATSMLAPSKGVQMLNHRSVSMAAALMLTTALAVDSAAAAPGQVKWSAGVGGGNAGSSPAITASASGTVFVGAMDGRLTAYTPAGAVLWTYDAGAPIGASPAVATGRVHVADMSGRVHV